MQKQLYVVSQPSRTEVHRVVQQEAWVRREAIAQEPGVQRPCQSFLAQEGIVSFPLDDAQAKGLPASDHLRRAALPVVVRSRTGDDTRGSDSAIIYRQLEPHFPISAESRVFTEPSQSLDIRHIDQLACKSEKVFLGQCSEVDLLPRIGNRPLWVGHSFPPLTYQDKVPKIQSAARRLGQELQHRFREARL